METSTQQDLVYSLRRRGVAEDKIPGLLEKANEKSLSLGDQFSVPDFVAGVPRGTGLSKGTKIGRVAAIFILVGIAAQLLLSGVLGMHLGFPGVLYYYGAVLAGLSVLVFSAYRVDRKLPRL
ncbi:hypothetical protein [Paenarthrobacter aromaticivorans]|uniref:DUF1707 domain-containing protein n=1 Tax=Paenarthrobacter aromaticivorans TaxID=2849150 RepID=A0ABS6I4E3_9MICC|nr:hypothetical protein [Paenarthrobacter sp. MMS21-TAE1-1]MBU8866608.1 hypothetical protein [Paenarthrobacter sp. MMS21-TAE1-1]